VKKLNLLWRLLHISWILHRNGLDDLILETHLFRPIRYLAFFTPNYWRKDELPPRGVRIRCALEELGPIFIKFGQILSTRRDLLPVDIADELALLQDNVAPFSGVDAQNIIETALESPVLELFQEFDDTPLASASIAQVHPATLKDGTKVIIKVLRPDVEKRIKRDIQLLYAIAGMARRFSKDGRRLRPVEVVHEFEKVLAEEVDLVREAANASQLRRNFENSDLLYVPEVYWDFTRVNVMVMERIYGIPIGDIEQLRAENADFKALAENGVKIFFSQVFRDNFFHADMHPGNIFAKPDGRYIAVDFGIVGSITLDDQRYLAENFLAFFNRDYLKVAQLHIDSGWVPKTTRAADFESAIRAVCEPIFEKPLKEISYGHLLLRLFQIARQFDMEVQPQLVLLQKTLLNIEGLGRELYPDLDLWDTAKPFLEEWYKEKIGPKATARRIKDKLPHWAEQLPEIPEMLHQVLSDASKGELEIQWKSAELEKMQRNMQRNHQRTISAITGGSLVIAAAIILGLDGYAPRMVAEAPLLTWVLGAAGGLLLVNSWGSGEKT
jgi:ubiquinone biosynthesis protein